MICGRGRRWQRRTRDESDLEGQTRALAARDKADELLRAGAMSGGASEMRALAEIEYESGRLGEAIRLYERATVQVPRNVGWRFRLAELLEEASREDEALSQVRLVLQYQPDSVRGKEMRNRLLERLDAQRDEKRLDPQLP